jgi:squalene-associated FAD-dependent desaturase
VAARRTVAVIGAGWAGLAAAVEATRRGHQVTLFDMAPHAGGRSRGVDVAGMALDNGQHILIGAYTQTLTLMRTVGVDIDKSLLRTPLRITYPEGSGLQLEAGAPLFAFARAVLRLKAWRWRDRLALLATASGWALRGFRSDAALTVAQLTRQLPASVRHELIDPLCVAALNTPSSDASAAVFLRVLKDALFSGPGSADLLLPRVSLSELLPLPATRWLEAAGARTALSQRVNRLAAQGDRWSVDDQVFDRVVLASSAVEAARLTQDFAPAWASTTAALRYEPIVTVYLRSEGARLPEPMLALRADAGAPAQFVFDRGQLGGAPGLLAFVISGAQPWVDAGQPATLQATLNQARSVLGSFLQGPLEAIHVLSERRATFRCTPGLQRSPMKIAPGLHAAGDHVIGPYPATLEGAVRSGREAVHALDRAGRPQR